VTFATQKIEPIAGEPYMSTYSGETPPGTLDPLFVYDPNTGNAMAPYLATGWSVSQDGLTLTMKIRQNIPWNPPKGFESMASQLGNVTAQDIADWLNTCNAVVNPNSTCGDGGDFAGYGGEATAPDDSTVTQPLNAPVFFCTPYTEFGCLSAARSPNLTLREVALKGKDWANKYSIGTGPFIQGECIEGNRCTTWALPAHWAKAASIKSFNQIQVPESNTRLAMLKNGQADMAEADFSVVPGIMKDYAAGKTNVRFLQMEKGDLITQSLIYTGNLWEENQALTGDALNPWNSPALAQDYAWIGDPWQQIHPDKVKYTDTNNPPGVTDMEQARLVRLALGTAICRDSINQNLLGGLGEVLYSEYMGPQYPGWDPNRTSGVWTFDGKKISATGTEQSVPWKLNDCDQTAAGKLLDDAGFPKDSSGMRTGITGLKLEWYPNAEGGQINQPIADTIVSEWTKLGVPVSEITEDYSTVISQRMRKREQFWPVLKNGDVNSNVYPVTWPYPLVDSSLSRPGWGVGFESPFLAQEHLFIQAQKDASVATQHHLQDADYMIYWQLYNGVYQEPRGILVTDRIKSWDSNLEQYGDHNGMNHYENIVVNQG